MTATVGKDGPPALASAFFLSQSDHSLSLPTSPIISIPELDLFGDHTPSVKQNGTKEPDAFDLDVRGEALAEASRDTPARRTPESFLGPSASSLVNLDSLVKVPQAVKTRNPFLTGRTLPCPCWGLHTGVHYSLCLFLLSPIPALKS